MRTVPHSSPFATIDTQAISHNLRHLRALSHGPSPRTRMWAVVKADAYGHGLSLVLPALAEADGAAVQTLDEAYACRQLGWNKPILIMGDTLSTDALRDPRLYPLHLTIAHERQLQALWNKPDAGDVPRPHIWLQSHGELHHGGFASKTYRQTYIRLRDALRAGRLAGLGHLLHYANAERPASLRRERAAFQSLVAGLAGPWCTENSAALLSDPGFSGNAPGWVRCGIALYGISPLPGQNGAELGLVPAMRLQAPLYAEHGVSAGESIGYGGLFQARRDTRVAMIRCGYADGYPRTFHTPPAVLLRGIPCPVIGRVSMGTLTADVSAVPSLIPGERATLWGAPDLPIEAVATAAGTIPAHLCAGLTARVVRHALDL